MNGHHALVETLATRRVCYFSRSRNALWRKGRPSGQAQHLKELRLDCDGDTLLLLVDQEGVARHTRGRNRSFRPPRDGELAGFVCFWSRRNPCTGGHAP